MGAIAKCIDAGYKPWKSVNGTSLANHHQACTRMLRADYCGTGASYTTDGMALNVLDSLGIQRDTRGSTPQYDWTFDAEWDADGARCIDDYRAQRPDCFSAKNRCRFSSTFTSGTLIKNFSSTCRDCGGSVFLNGTSLTGL
jgi:hypothetical protein